jgi:hypothetical protein
MWRGVGGKPVYVDKVKRMMNGCEGVPVDRIDRMDRSQTQNRVSQNQTIEKRHYNKINVETRK